MKLKTWRKKQMKDKRFRKAYIKLLRKENREYSRLIMQEYHQAFIGGEEIKAFRMKLLEGKVKG